MNYGGYLTLVAFLLFAVAPCIQSCATMYEHVNYRGLTLDPRSGDEVATLSFNDKVSSAKVQPGCTLTLYQHSNYGGRSVELRVLRNIPNLGVGGLDFNDRTSSYKCHCR